ncbi:type III-A CRISPR-associated RAMP protein Csm4 [Desulforamulus hydrothermalis]|uniref:CRISPR system Cms protein Csm4 n=1 Tax=Desulforamulus hydrothermalis Lam5 = DSM 18033 TaxID=1121428 RepID=K8E882_9FIRM|nr:hypothetical protein [Desulforamulus hydrothermalis]CCO07708.1 conserved hypothetical protein [Desulforamulus hydrothermalis Lam5 = DSM 18033]SHH33415.1 CRISPR-associated protein Csm4 [Desulforamulus hydrothermalis Lam5 = DSM 18033]
MEIYRIKIQPKGSFITPFQADAIFGGLCWVIRYFKGNEYLKTMLGDFCAGRPWFVLSNAFPGDLLPKPMVKMKRAAPASFKEELNQAREGKRLKKILYLTPAEFNQLAAGSFCSIETKKAPIILSANLYNQINRITGSTREGGQLYELEESYLHPDYNYFSVYIKVKEVGLLELLLNVFEQLGSMGFGKRKSVGKGCFNVIGVEKYNFKAVENANAFISLSNFVPAPSDPVEGNYSILVKYGKLGEHLAMSGNPFKSPLIMIKAGSVFRANGPIKHFYGRMVENIAPQHVQVLQYALAFSIPARWED